MPERVLVTGAAGLIGGVLCTHLGQQPDVYEVHGLARSRVPRNKGAELQSNDVARIPAARFHIADIRDMSAVRAAVEGMDVVVHLAAVASSRADFQSTLESNIGGTYNVLEAARQSGVRRVVFASTIQVVFGYRDEPPISKIVAGPSPELPAVLPRISLSDPVRPTSFYSASKVHGEALCHLYAHRYGLSCLAVRIGSVPSDDRPQPAGRGHWCSHRDLAQLFQLCIDAPEELRYDVFFASSRNRLRWIDIEHAREILGYKPIDDAEEWLSEA